MRKIIVNLDGSGNLTDKNGSHMACIAGMSFDFEEPKEKEVDAAQLLGLGATPDDLIKLRAAGLI